MTILRSNPPIAARTRQTSIVLGLVGLALLSPPGVHAGSETAASRIFSRSYGPADASRILGRSGITTPAAVEPRAATPAAVVSRRPDVRRPDARRLDARRLDPVSTERVDRYSSLIDHHAHDQHVDGDLVRAIIYAESGGDRQAVSRSGAIGLMQLMPETAAELGIADPFDANASIEGGTRYLRALLDRFGATEIALWAYNAGPSAVQRAYLPDETASYVPRVLKLRKQFKSRRVLAAAGH